MPQPEHTPMNERQYRARQKKLFEKARTRALARAHKTRMGRIRKLWLARTRRMEALARAQEMGR